jgi:hypothetical protein
MQKWLGVALLVIALNASAQLQYLPIATNGQNSARVDSISYDTLSLPFWDDFSGSNQIDHSLWRYGEDVFISNTQSIQAPTKNVASFDGLNFLGHPHNVASEYNGAGDSLVSHSIDLSQLPEAVINTVYLSFYWQLKGLGELPNTDDSLRLQFLDSAGRWVTQDINSDPDELSLIGGLNQLVFDEDSVQRFKQVIIPVTHQFLHEGFQFRFQSFSSLNGYYDNWHIDYVYLNSHRSSSDTLHFDRTLSNSEQSLFFPYVAIPTEHLRTGTFSLQESISLNNLDNTFHPAIFTHQLTEKVQNQSTAQDFIMPSDMFPLETGRTETVFAGTLPALLGDSLILESEFIYLTGDKRLFETVDSNGDTIFLNQDLTINDTIRNRYVLHDYLSYDDGSAEIAAGINLNQGQVAVQYNVNTQDTLTDILVYFPPISPSTSGESITIRVWSELDNQAIVREVGGVIEASARNQFQRFTLDVPFIVRDTFYIGFQQFTDNYIGIGLDKNTTGGSARIFTNTNRQWVQNDRIEGSLMIRPQFRNGLNYVLSTPLDMVRFYPNPAAQTLFLHHEVIQVIIYSLSGNELLRVANEESIDISHFQSGLYIMELFTQNTRQVEKLLIQR